jgi:hypothetical protein
LPVPLSRAVRHGPILEELPGVSTVILALAFVLVARETDANVHATRLDGTSVSGSLQSWENREVMIRNIEGDHPLAAEQLLSLEWKVAGSAAEKAARSGRIELVDGTSIPIADFRSSATKADATLAAPLPSEFKTLSVSRKLLADVLLQSLSAEAAQQWQEIRDMNFASDVLVLLKRDGKSLDYVEGVMGDVADDKIEFKMDDESLRVDRAKVAGFTYYRPRRSAADPLCIVRGRSGLRALIKEVRLVDDSVQLTTVGGAQLRWPLQDIDSADFSAGKLQYLSDMDPASESWTPLVGLPPDAALAAKYGQPRRNQSAFGGPLTLRLELPAVSSAEHTRAYSKGLAIRSRTEVVYRVPSDFKRFAALAGIDPATSAGGNVRLELYGDDRLLLKEDVSGHDPPRSIELDIAGVKRLKILVDYGRNLDAGDWLNLCDARIIK